MSKIKLVTIQGYGEQGIPRVPGSQQTTETGIEVSDARDVAGVIRYDFEPDPDGSVRSSPAIDPVVRVEHVNILIGRVLTVVDAMGGDGQQRKAQKDLFKQAVWGWYDIQVQWIAPEPASL